MWWLATLAVANVDVYTSAVGAAVQHQLSIRQGADPGYVTAALLDFATADGLTAPPNHTSAYRKDNADLLYVGKAVGWVNMSSTNPVSVLGTKELATLTPTFGMCDGRLFVTKLPRHCRRGYGVEVPCALATTCTDRFTWRGTQHAGVCGTAITLGDMSFDVACNKTITFGGQTVDAAVAAANPVISVYAAGLTWEYDADLEELRVWEPPTSDDALVEVLPMMAFIVFLSVWQHLTRSLNGYVRDNDRAGVAAIWTTMAHHSMFAGDVVVFAAGSKSYGLLTEAKVFFPESVDNVFGHEFALAYSFWFICAMGAVTVVLLAALAAMALTVYPVKALANYGAWIKRAVGHKREAALAIRCAVEIVVLFSLHVTAPMALGPRFHAIVGLGAGGAACAVVGRDATLIVPSVSRAGALLTTAAVAAVWAHASVFMMMEAFHGQGAHGTVPAVVSAALAFQCVAAGALWSRGAPATAPDHSALVPPLHMHHL